MFAFTHSFIHLFVIYFELLFFYFEFIYFRMKATTTTTTTATEEKTECNIFHFERVEFEQRDGFEIRFWLLVSQVKTERNGMRFDKHFSEQTEEKTKKHTHRQIEERCGFFSFLYCTAWMRMLRYCCCQCYGSCFFSSPTFNF